MNKENVKLTIEYNMPEDIDQFERVHFAHDAWQSIDAAITLIRNHFKHDAGGTPENVLAEVRTILSEARSKIE